jgi:hypothetical protein
MRVSRDGPVRGADAQPLAPWLSRRERSPSLYVTVSEIRARVVADLATAVASRR